MIFIAIYLVTLFIAPQLWVEPFVGIRVDTFMYPIWLMVGVFAYGERLKEFKAQDWFFVGMIAWIIMSSAVNGFRPYSGEIITNYIKWFLLYKLVIATIGTVERARGAVFFLVIFGVILAIEGIQHRASADGLGWAGQALGWIDPDAAARGEPGRTRWINIFDGPGVFCVVYTVALPFVLNYMTSVYGFPIRILGVGLTALLGVAIYYTGSRGGFLTALALLALFMAIRFRVNLVKLATIGGVVATLFMLAPSHLTTMDDQSKSAKHRVDMWIEGVEMVQQNPVFGIGKGNFLGYTGRLIAHNSGIEVMGETGLVGLFLWLGLIYMSVKGVVLYMNETENSKNRAVAVGLGLSVVGYIVSAMFVTLEYETFYFLHGLCAVVGRCRKEPLVFDRGDLRNLVMMTVGWFLVVKVFVTMYN